MKYIFNVMWFAVFVVLALCSFMGCLEKVEYPNMKIDGELPNFLLNNNSYYDKEMYLAEHKIEIEDLKFCDTYFFVNNKDISYDKGCIWLYACSLDSVHLDTFSIEYISLVSNDGNIIHQEDLREVSVTATTLNNIDGVLLLTYTISDDWYYIGNKLTLTIKVSCGEQNHIIVYDVNIDKLSRHVFPT